MNDHGEPIAQSGEASSPYRAWSVREVAARYRVDPSTIYREIAAGKLTALRVGPNGGVFRVTAAALEAYEALITVSVVDAA